MENFEEESSPGGRERLQMKELEALQEEIISKLTVNTFLDQGPGVPPSSNPISALDHGALPQSVLEADWETHASPRQQRCPDTATQGAVKRTGPAAGVAEKRSDNTTRATSYQQQVWLSPRSKPVLTPARPAVATPNQYTGTASVGVVTTQPTLTTPTYPTVTPPTQSMAVPPHQTTLNESATRVNLIEKHAKHISDLTTYYEGELKKLKEQASDVVQHPSSSEPPWQQWRTVVGSSGGAVHSPAHSHSPSLVGSPVKASLQFSASPFKSGSVLGAVDVTHTRTHRQRHLGMRVCCSNTVLFGQEWGHSLSTTLHAVLHVATYTHT